MIVVSPISPEKNGIYGSLNVRKRKLCA